MNIKIQARNKQEKAKTLRTNLQITSSNKMISRTNN